MQVILSEKEYQDLLNNLEEINKELDELKDSFSKYQQIINIITSVVRTDTEDSDSVYLRSKVTKVISLFLLDLDSSKNKNKTISKWFDYYNKIK